MHLFIPVTSIALVPNKYGTRCGRYHRVRVSHYLFQIIPILHKMHVVTKEVAL